MRRVVFVFGSNTAGRHGLGAALEARTLWGARYGVGHGHHGRSYAIPTKHGNLRTLPLEQIARYVQALLDYARANPHLTFYVTPVGCGLAGLTQAQIRPLFAGAPRNCWPAPTWADTSPF